MYSTRRSYRSSHFATLALAAAVLPLVTATAAHGQSMPPGQVSHRMSTRSKKPTAQKEPVALPADTHTLLDNRPELATLATDAVDSDKVTTDLQNEKKALGSANQAYLSELARLDNSPGSDPFTVDYLRSLSSIISDATSQEEAESIVETAGTFMQHDLDAVNALISACGLPNAAYTLLASKQKQDCIAQLTPRKQSDIAANLELQHLNRDILKKYGCTYSVKTTTEPKPGSSSAPPATPPDPQYTYEYPRWWTPMNGAGCNENSAQNLTPILNFFSVSGPTEFASDAKYLYNAKLSTSQVSSQLMTGTFNPGFLPPFQAVLSSTATSGSSNSSTSTTTTAAAARLRGVGAAATRVTTTAAAGSTDSTATAMAKIQAGGDFNLSLPTPLLYHANGKGSITGYFMPNVGFSINGFSGQNTITDATEYAINVPVEFYAQTYSLEPGTNGLPSATFFVDVKPAAEIISTALAKAISPNTSKLFFMGQADLGIEFAQSVRISFQYIYSQKSIFDPTAGLATTPTATQNPSGFHLAVSFSPQNTKKAAQN